MTLSFVMTTLPLVQLLIQAWVCIQEFHCLDHHLPPCLDEEDWCSSVDDALYARRDKVRKLVISEGIMGFWCWVVLLCSVHSSQFDRSILSSILTLCLIAVVHVAPRLAADQKEMELCGDIQGFKKLASFVSKDQM